MAGGNRALPLRWLLFGACLVPACWAAGAPMQPPQQALCFVHVGPQDKPMPAFCVTMPGLPTTGHAASDQDEKAEPIVVSPATLQALVSSLQAAAPADPSRAAAFGQYRVRSLPPGLDLLVTPQTMRQCIGLLQHDAAGSRGAASALIDRLSRRLPV